MPTVSPTPPPAPAAVAAHRQPSADATVDDLRVGGRALGEFDPGMRIAIDRRGVSGELAASAASTAAADLLAGRRARTGVNGMLRLIGTLGAESNLRGVTLTTTQDGFQAALARAQVEMDLRAAPQTTRGALQQRAEETFAQASKSSLAGAFVSDPDARHGWLVLSPQRSLPLVTAWQHPARRSARDDIAMGVDYAARSQETPEDAEAFRERALRRLHEAPDQTTNLRRNLVGKFQQDLLASVRTLAHEVDHSVSPLPDRDVERFRRLEEAAVDSVASTRPNIERWRSALRAPAVPETALEGIESGYAGIVAQMRGFMRLGGFDTEAARREVAQGSDVRLLPDRLAAAIVGRHALPQTVAPKISAAIMDTFRSGNDRTGEVMRLVRAGGR